MGGAGLPFLVIVAVLVIVVLALGGFGLLPWFGGRRRRADELAEEEGQASLRYVVPEGQDAVTVLGALRRAGLEAVPSMVGGREGVLIAGTDRERARRAIADADLNLEGDDGGDPGRVRFADE